MFHETYQIWARLTLYICMKKYIQIIPLIPKLDKDYISICAF